MTYGDSNHATSNGLIPTLDILQEDHPVIIAGPSSHNLEHETPLLTKKLQLKERLAQFDAEIKGYEEEIRSIKALVSLRKEERRGVLNELESTIPYAGKGKGKVTGGINYGKEEFEWSGPLKARMRSVFDIDDFRLCQRGVCNANMDGRDIVCVMPTGGGKSLTYQAPALLQSGCTLVISPLISLITDQILYLKEAGVQAVKLTGGTSKEEAKDINQRLLALANHRVTSKEDEIKLCYVTPEKMSKSKSFLSMIQKLVTASKLARFVIDEAHCVSQLGHDFRPDYHRLRSIRQLFPQVPIMALTATCPPKVLHDLIQTLGLKPVVDGNNADTQGTAYFTSPLYRHNLHYYVQPKPEKATDVLQMMSNYILEHHANDTGIVYCLTRKDAENVAAGLRKCSEGKILTGVYHAERSDREKEGLHIAWRMGTIKVVCATIAFGLGIDKKNVRYVLHHSLSKSIEGYYQESGRAGRDGQHSDCILYYRPQDGVTISSMVAHEEEGREKLHSMLNFAQDLQQCRKIHFAKYFSHSSDLAMSSWATEDSTALTQCGHCDNCTRPPDTVDHRDVTLEVWQLLKIIDTVMRDRADITLKKVAPLARGAGGGAYEVSRVGKGGKGTKTLEREKVNLDLVAVAGGPVKLTEEETEYLLVEMLVRKYLQEKYTQTSYITHVYLVRGPLAPQLTRLPRAALEAPGSDNVVKFECTFRKQKSKAGKKPGASQDKGKLGVSRNGEMQGPMASTQGGKRKRGMPTSREEWSEIEVDEDDNDYNNIASNSLLPQHYPQPTQDAGSESEGSKDSSVFGDDWSHSMRPVTKTSEAPPRKKVKSPRGMGGHFARKVVIENNNEVLVLSD